MSSSRGSSLSPTAASAAGAQRVRSVKSGGGGGEDFTRLHGEFSELRSQVTEIVKRVRKVESAKRGDDPGPSQRELQMQRELRELREQQQPQQPQPSVDPNGAALRKEVDALKRSMQEQQKQTATRMDDLQRELRSMQEQQRAAVQTVQSLQQEVRSLSETAAKLQGDTQVLSMGRNLQENSNKIHELERKLYDAGTLVRQLPPVPVVLVEDKPPPPPIGTVALCDDIYSARLLLKLGWLKHDREMEVAEKSVADSSLEEEEDEPLNWFDRVSGLKVPGTVPGEVGYEKLWWGSALVCVQAIVCKGLALSVIFAFGMRSAHVCLDHKMNHFESSVLRLSKALGTLVVGMLMGKAFMDTVNYVMVAVLLGGRDPELLFLTLSRVLTITLAAGAHALLFACATRAEDVWLKMTLLAFVGQMAQAALGVAKSGFLGHTLRSDLNKVNYSISFYAQYPWWFGPTRTITMVLMFGFVCAWASLMVVMPIPQCPEDGSPAANIFVAYASTFMPAGTVLPEGPELEMAG